MILKLNLPFSIWILNMMMICMEHAFMIISRFLMKASVGNIVAMAATSRNPSSAPVQL